MASEAHKPEQFLSWFLPQAPAVAHTADTEPVAPLSLRPLTASPDVSVTLTKLESEDEDEASDYADDDAKEDLKDVKTLELDPSTTAPEQFEIDIDDDFALNGESKRPVLDTGKKPGRWARKRAVRKTDIIHHIEGSHSLSRFIHTCFAQTVSQISSLARNSFSPSQRRCCPLVLPPIVSNLSLTLPRRCSA